MFIAKVNKEDLIVLHDLVKAQKVTPVIDRCYGLSETSEAIRYLEEGHARAKVVITLSVDLPKLRERRARSLVSPRHLAKPVWSKISNVLKRLGFRSRTFFAQLLSETSRACTIRVRRSSLRRLWNDLGSHACLHRQRRRSAVPHSPTARPAPQPLIWSALRLESGAPFQGATFVSLVHSSATLLSPTTLNRYGKRRAEYAL